MPLLKRMLPAKVTEGFSPVGDHTDSSSLRIQLGPPQSLNYALTGLLNFTPTLQFSYLWTHGLNLVVAFYIQSQSHE